jgi:hypothetical protein
LFSLVTLWASELAERTGRLPVLGAAWYKNPDPTFSDGLAAVRRTLWAEEAVRHLVARIGWLRASLSSGRAPLRKLVRLAWP